MDRTVTGSDARMYRRPIFPTAQRIRASSPRFRRGRAGVNCNSILSWTMTEFGQSCLQKITSNPLQAVGSTFSPNRGPLVSTFSSLPVESSGQSLVRRTGFSSHYEPGCSAICWATRPSPERPLVVETVKEPVGPTTGLYLSPAASARKLPLTSEAPARTVSEAGRLTMSPCPHELSAAIAAPMIKSPAV